VLSAVRRRALAVLAAAVALLAVVSHPGEGDGFWGAVEGRLLDLRFALRGPLPPPDGVAVVLIDDADISRLGAYPPPREALAEAVTAILGRGASAVALDLLLVDALPGDAALASALSGGDRAILAVAMGSGAPAAAAAPQDGGFERALGRSGFDVVVDAPPAFVVPPIGPASALAGAARFGHVNVAPEPDAALRRMPAALPVPAAGGEVWIPGLALAALRRADPDRLAPLVLRGPRAGGAVELGPIRVPLDGFGSIPLVHYGPAGQVPTWALREVAEADLGGRAVFLGLSASGAGDRHPTPFDAAMPGVEAHATLAANLLEGRALRRDGAAWLLGGALALVAAAAAFAAAVARPSRAALGLPLVALATAAALHGAFLAGWWLDAVTVLMALAAGAGAGLVHQIARQARRAENLARYQSPSVVDALAEEARPRFDGRSQQAIALFVDVAGFTTLSEAMGPDATADFLRGLHVRIERLSRERGGMVDQFSGDGAMVTFGATGGDGPGARDAEAALDLIAELQAVAGGAVADAPVLRIGAHVGRVQLSVLGGERHRHLTIAGDAVNVASRLQEVAREAGARVALSDGLLQQTGDPHGWISRLGLRDLGLRALRGREMRLHVWAGPGGEAG
jgi:adenylate cyclase